MKKHRLFAFYCTLLLPIGALIGAGVGSESGFQLATILIGSAVGVLASYFLVRSSASGSA